MTYFWIGLGLWLAIGLGNYAVAYGFMSNMEFTRTEDSKTDRLTALGFFLPTGLIGSAVLLKDRAYGKYPLRWR